MKIARCIYYSTVLVFPVWFLVRFISINFKVPGQVPLNAYIFLCWLLVCTGLAILLAEKKADYMIFIFTFVALFALFCLKQVRFFFF